MIDGIKILCSGTDPKKWENNDLLSFTIKVDEQTGEIKSNTKIAFFKGLQFFLVPSTISNTTHCIIRGSLAKYYNDGRNNAFDFHLSMLWEVIENLQTYFHIDPCKAKIQSLEFGINVNTNHTPKQIINGIRAYKNDAFSSFKTDEVFNGKVLKKQLYNYKVYDKSHTIPKTQNGLLRIEYAIKSTKITRVHGIEFLNDLFDSKRIYSLFPLLTKVWMEMIFYDKGMNWRKMKRIEKEKMLFYLDATNWAKFTRMQRLRAKKNFRKLYDFYCKSTTQQEILTLMKNKLDKLAASNGYVLCNYYRDEEADKELRFTHLDKGIKSIQNDLIKITTNYKSKSVKERNVKCLVCNADISKKRLGTKYCSKSCNNFFHSKNRKENRRTLKKVEVENLNKLINLLPKQKFYYVIFFNDYSSSRLLRDDCVLNEYHISLIREIEIRQSERAKALLSLTSYRARKFIKLLTTSLYLLSVV